MLSELLTRAREHLRGGWHEPLSLASDGTICDRQSEGIEKFCVHDALLTAAPDVDAFLAAEEALTKQLRLDPLLPRTNAWGHAMTLNEWAAEPERTHGQVLQLFTRAHAQALTKEIR